MTAEYDNSVSVVLAILAVLAFVLMMGFAIVEFVTKVARPQSSVNFNRMTLVVSGATAGVFVLCLSDAVEFIIAPDMISPYLHLFGYCLFQSLFAYFLILVGFPLRNQNTLHNLVQDVAAIASVASGLQILTLVVIGMYLDVADDIMFYVYLITKLSVIFASLLYMLVFIRRFHKKLRNPKGNETQLAKSGLYCAGSAIVALGLSIFAISQATEGKSLIYMFSRFILLATVGVMIYMKVIYDRGLMKVVGGRIIYSQAYTSSDTEEIELLTSMDKPQLGVSAPV